MGHSDSEWIGLYCEQTCMTKNMQKDIQFAESVSYNFLVNMLDCSWGLGYTEYTSDRE